MVRQEWEEEGREKLEEGREKEEEDEGRRYMHSGWRW
jgi:hypothetical protein